MHQGSITGEEYTAETGTYRWMAPEIMQLEEYSFMVDVYSFGIVVQQLVAHEELFKELSQIEAAGTVAIDGGSLPIPKNNSTVDGTSYLKLLERTSKSTTFVQ